jgi:hypothetical protein
MKVLVLSPENATEIEKADLLASCALGKFVPLCAKDFKDLEKKGLELRARDEPHCVVSSIEYANSLAMHLRENLYCKRVFLLHTLGALEGLAAQMREARDMHFLIPMTNGINPFLAFALAQTHAPRSTLELLAGGTEVFQWRVHNETTRKSCIEAFEGHLDTVLSSGSELYLRLCERACSVADELLQNARQASGAEPVICKFGLDSKHILFSCRDTSGSLLPAVFFDHLFSSEPQRSAEQRQRSEGVGLKRIFRESSALLAQVRHQQWTDMTLLMEIQPSNKARLSKPKFLGFF